MQRFLGGLLAAQLILGCSPAAPPATPTPTASPTGQAGPTTRESAIVAVNDLTNRGDLDGAVALATDSLQKYPDSFELLANRASIYLHRKQYEKAREDFTQALKTVNDESRWTLYAQRARCSVGLHQYAAAEKDFAEANRLLGQAKTPDPIFVEQLARLRADNLSLDLRYKESIPFYTSALKLQPENPASLAGRAYAYYQLGEKGKYATDLAALEKVAPQGAQEVREAVRTPTSPGDKLAKEGTLKLREGDFEAALKLLDEAVKLEPKSAQAQQKRGSALQNLKRFPEAIAAYTLSYDLDHNEVALFNRAICYFNESNFAEGKKDLEQFVKISKSPEAIAQAKSILAKIP